VVGTIVGGLVGGFIGGYTGGKLTKKMIKEKPILQISDFRSYNNRSPTFKLSNIYNKSKYAFFIAHVGKYV